ncbi:hypothetical protein GCM10009069_13770 [Algimonas arctica]|uniref:DUF3995 domain-containing protein n=1 Tax=Algimonas arctica TaxID=1479486 RepID=A0A8J3G272_9PROT|nr:DUF3995 domain-containing protein [Algimonas arctica]GHA91804.1 hypothetical protein GCM10009069_13770 [Algimonas arctica]
MNNARLTGWVLFCVLSLIAVLHIYWAFGGLWPAQTLDGLIDTVIGDPRFEQMPPVWMTLAVAGAILSAGWIALERAGIVRCLPRWMVTLGCWGLIAVFALRGLSAFLVAAGIRTVSPALTEPFATNDLWLYGPLCLLIALGFLSLTFRKLRQ